MAKSKIVKNIFLTICVMILTSCSFSPISPNYKEKEELMEMPKVLFLYTYYDYIDENELIKYIDNAGNLHMVNLFSEKGVLAISDIYEKIDISNDEIIDSVDKDKLKANYQFFLQVPVESGEYENLIYTESFLDVELGRHRWYGLRYDKKGELEYIILAGEGDTAIENQDEDAQKIASWLRGILYKE